MNDVIPATQPTEAQVIAFQEAQADRRRVDIERNPSDEWPEARPLQRSPSTPTKFPVDALGEVLGRAAEKIAEVIQAPVAICGNSVLAAATLAAQAHANVVIDGRRHPLSDFFITIGKTGERKSAVDQIAQWPVQKRQESLRQEYKLSYSDYEQNERAFKKASDEAMSSANNKTYAAKKEALSALGKAPEKPLEPFLICEEPTYEGMVKMLRYGQPSIGLFSDEGGRFIGGHGMNNDNLLKTASGMSGFWDGKQVSRTRSEDGSCLLVGRRVSCHLMAQPDVAQLMLSNAVLLEQGLLSRCLVTWPDSTAGTRMYKEIDLSGADEIKSYSAALLKILETPHPLHEGTLNELNPRDLVLDAEAKAVWIEYHNAIERELVDGGELSQVRGIANKAPEHAARMAGTLAIIHNIGCGSISAVWIKAGIRLMTHYLNEAQRLYEAGVVDPELKEAERLLAWLMSKREKAPGPGGTVSLPTVYQFGPAGVRTAKKARDLMHILEEHFYVRQAADGKRREAWRVKT